MCVCVPLVSNVLFTGSPPHLRMGRAGKRSSKTSILTRIRLPRPPSPSPPQVLAVGLLTAIGDHILKPFLAAAFGSPCCCSC